MLLGFPSSSFLVQRPFSNGRKFLLEDALGNFIGLGLGSGPGLEPRLEGPGQLVNHLVEVPVVLVAQFQALREAVRVFGLR